MAEAPVITSLVANSPGAITIAWVHSGQSGALGYRIDRNNPPASWTTNNNHASHTDLGLNASTTYSYRVCAIYPGGLETCSGWKPVTTMAPEPNRPPTDRTPPTLTALEVKQNSITLKWSKRDRVHIRWRENTPGSSPLENQVDIDHDEAPGGYHHFSNLKTDTPYTFRIQGADLNFVGVAVAISGWSAPLLQISTLAPPPPPIIVPPIYAVAANGDLLWNRHEGWRDGTLAWAANVGKKVGTGWNGFSSVFGGDGGIIYAVQNASRDPRTGQHIGGDLLWYNHFGFENGTSDWAYSEGKKVGHKWNNLSSVFYGGNGIIYAVAANGDLLWNRHEGWRHGTFDWAADESKKVGTGWNNFSSVFSGGDGIIYAVQKASIDPRTGQHIGGDLLWHNHIGFQDGTFDWAYSEGKKVGHKWNKFSSVLSGGNGIIYTVAANGDLLWYDHIGWRDGTFAWAANEAKRVSNGWNFKHIFNG